jgi:WD40 repeat protein
MHTREKQKIKNSIQLLLLLLIAGIVFASPVMATTGDNPILVVDSGGHKGVINDIVVSADGRYLVSASDDKTIRVWDIKRKKEVRKVLGWIGSGSSGKIYAMALSPDDRWLAVGGFLGHPQNLEEVGAIRIYDFTTGKLRYLLKSHTDTIFDLAFSPNGNQLVSGSGDTTVKVWDAAQDFNLIKTLEAHRRSVYAVAVLPNKSIVSAGNDGQLILWFNFDGLQDSWMHTSYQHSHFLNYIAVSKDWIAVSGLLDDKQILIFDHSFKRHKVINSETIPSGLAFSANGRLLLAGTASNPNVSIIYDSWNNFQEFSRFTKHDNSVAAVTFLKDNTAVTGGGSNFDIYFWKDGQEKGHIAGKGKSIWAVGLDNSGFHWGNSGIKSGEKHLDPLEHRFDLNSFNIGISEGNPARCQNRYKDWALSHREGGEYGNRKATLVISKNNSEKAAITRGSHDGYSHTTYGFAENGIILSGGSNGFLCAYSRKGKELSRFIGHTGEIFDISTKGNGFISGSVDQVIKLWNLGEVQTGTKEIYPMLNLFVGDDGEWVLWSKSGYYAASAEGDKYVGFHVNAGLGKEAHFYPASRFKATLYRPDIIRLILETESEEAAINQASKTRRTKIKIDTGSILPPLIELKKPKSNVYQVDGDHLHLECLITPQSKHPITEIQIFVNGRPVADARAIQRKKQSDSSFTINQDIDLPLAKNLITVIARTAFSSSNPLILDVTKKIQGQDIFKPSLYFLGIGVSAYSNPAFNLQYADADAVAVEKMFNSQAQVLYNKVQTNVLTNSEATKDAILDGLDWLEREVTQHDVAVIFIAGHGTNEKGNYYFLGHDANPEKLRRTAVNWRDFKDIISGLPCKVILLADTCHSGAIMGDGRRGGLGNSITSAVKDLIDAGSGQIIMTAATGSSYSLERPEWGHGAFTKALLEGLDRVSGQFKADHDKDGVVTVKEIDLYVTNRVKILTNGKQKPTTIIPESVPDFPVTAR